MNWPFDDGSDLPLRDGFDVGGAQERTMASMVGGYSGIRTVEELNPDGSITTLRTRGGHPIFETTYKPSPAVVVDLPPCLQGEIRSASVSASWYVAWHAAEPLIISSDAVWRLDPTPWKRWSGYTNDGSATLGTLVHFNFSSPTTAAAIDPAAAPAHVQMVEGAWSSRTWYAKQAAIIPHAGLLACVQRLKSTTFTQDGVTPPYSFNWTYSDDGEATTDAATPACINRSGHETGLDTRTYTFPSSPTGMTEYRRIARLAIILAGFKTAVQTTRPDGFLPAFRQSDQVCYVGDPTYPPAANTRCSDLAKLLSIGQPWHGLCTQTAIERPGFDPTTPISYYPPDNTNTRYFKAPLPPGAPDAALLQPGFAAAGYAYLDDVVLRSGRDYSPKKAEATVSNTYRCTDIFWYHCDDAGVVRKLSCAANSTLTSNSTQFYIRNYGPPNGRDMGYVQLEYVEVVTTDPDALLMYSQASGTRRFCSGQGDYQSSVSTTGGIVSPKMQLAKSHPIAASPDGRQIAVLTGAYNSTRGVAMIYTVATFDIASDLTVTGPNYVFQYEEQLPTDAVTETFWDTWCADVSGTYPSITNWWAYGYKYTRTICTPKTQTTCHGVSYDKHGTLNLFLRNTQKFLDAGNWLAGSPNTLSYDTGVPLTDPQPATTPADGEVVATEYYPDLTNAHFSDGQAWMDALGIDEASAVTSISAVYRLANNVVVANVSRPSVTQEIATPSGHTTLAATFPTYTTNEKWASWNPRTEQLAGRNDGTGAISWI